MAASHHVGVGTPPVVLLHGLGANARLNWSMSATPIARQESFVA
jgi:hypothetical protein